MTFPENPSAENPQEQHHEPTSSRVVKSLSGLALGGLFFAGGAVANHYLFEDHQPAPLTASMLEASLNNTGGVDKATVEVGYQIPVTQPNDENAVAIINPIKLDTNTYAYVADTSASDGVHIKTIKFDGPLPVADIGGHSKEYPHEVITPLAKVYTDYTVGTNTDVMSRYYSVIMGTQSGDTANLNIIPNGAPPDSVQEIKNQQQGEIAMASVGELAGGK